MLGLATRRALERLATEMEKSFPTFSRLRKNTRRDAYFLGLTVIGCDFARPFREFC